MTKIDRLPSGFKIIYHHHPEVQTTSMVLTCKVGSIDEGKDYRGSSHMIEHMVFKGTRKYPNAESITKIFDDMGAFFDATTDTHISEFIVKCHSNDFHKCITLLMDILCCSIFSMENFQNEKNVVIEEILEDKDDTETQCLENLYKIVFYGTDYARKITGSVDDVNHLSRKNLLKFYKTYYIPNNMLLSINTNLSYDQIINELKKIKYIHTKYKIQQLYHPKIKYIPSDENIIVIENKKLQQTHLAIGFNLPFGFLNQKEDYIASIVAHYLGGSMSSILYLTLRQKEAIGYTIWCDTLMKPEQGCFAIYVSFEHSKLIRTLDVIYEILDRLNKYGISKKKLQIIVQAYKKSIEISMESPMFIAEYFGTMGQYGILDMPNVFPSIDSKDVNDFIKKYLNPKYSKISIITK